MKNKINLMENDLGEKISVLKIKELVIEANENAIIARTTMLDDEKIDDKTKIKLKKNIKELTETIKLLKETGMHYKFNDLFVSGRNGLGPAKFKPEFINKWKIHMDTIGVPPTILRVIEDLKVIRPYNHIKFNDTTNEYSNLGTTLIEFTSKRVNALKQFQYKTFTISCSFSEGEDVSIEELENSLDGMDV